ncbi:metabolite traffic protein EboE [Kutzneria sp. NPDC051319]|uniref:metabolite traffic protein EboE n=1 Tax=Kutzneria sp. NPDC051319 TaxID=3155047 RepID=UPI00344A4C41
MRMRHPDGTVVHLGYCTNVHAAEDLDGVLSQLAGYGEPIRRTLGVDRLGLGLWLARDVVTELSADPAAVRRLRSELSARGLEVVTLNAFPYQGFHDEVVKKAVYLPDWLDEARLRYTVDCARVLAALLPDDAVRGSVSTLPLAWRHPWSLAHATQARRVLDRLAAELAAVADDTGRPVRVGMEPEPGCVLEHTAVAAEFLAGLDSSWIGLCLDTCHLAVAWEDPAAALAGLAAAGVPIVKVQASCALQADRPADPVTRAELARFTEPRFLHQAKEFSGGRVHSADDLPACELPAQGPWRVHYHVPLHADARPPLHTTRDHLVSTLDALFSGPSARCDHVEVETYTWSVLPDSGIGIVDGIASELSWARDALLASGLKEEVAS